jgi:hypothetical protein
MSMNTDTSIATETYPTAQDPELALDKVVAMLTRRLDHVVPDQLPAEPPA